jgi:hypothetical protein
MGQPLKDTAHLSERDKNLLLNINPRLLDRQKKDWFLREDRKVIYSGLLQTVRHLEQDTLEYTIDGQPVKVIFPLEQFVRFSKDRQESLTNTPVRLQGLPLKDEHSILLLQIEYPEQVRGEKLVKDHVMEMPGKTKNKLLLFTEGFKFCAFIFALLLSGQLFDSNEPERYRTLTYVFGACFLVFIILYFYIGSKKSSWLRPVPIKHFTGPICQVLYTVDNSGDGASDEVLYITGSKMFSCWSRNKDISPGDEVRITYRPFTGIGFRQVERPDVQEVTKIS